MLAAVMLDLDLVPKSLVENDAAAERWCGRPPWVKDEDDRLRNNMAAVQDLFAAVI